MDRYLVAISLGPVQSLIGAARRTRDLWCGSWLLSEAARAAARILHERQPECLIFPHLKDPVADLEPQVRPGDSSNVANILRAEVALPDAAAARALCEEAKAAAASRIAELGDSARSKMDSLGKSLREEVWLAQIDDILEMHSAWVLIPADGSYRQASKRLGGALAARKATRDFRACKPLSEGGLPKSSLDGARETVLHALPKGDKARRKLGLSGGEQLDALGFIKRLAGDPEQFTAIARIAADSWIECLAPEQQIALRDAYEPLVELGGATRTRGNDGIYKALPFDAMLLYEFRLKNALSQASGERELRALQQLQQCIKQISGEKAPSGGRTGAPVPYAAVLKADGDRMGALLSKAENASHARDISHTLHGFASGVRTIVREYRGHAIYAGGDDVLALLPLSQARECSDALACAFAKSLGGIAREMGVPENEHPTLSVGLGISHVMQPMGELRARSERAEHTAKGDMTKTPRNALAIVLGIRSGAEICWRARWRDTQAFEALDRMISAHRDGTLPTRVAYELRDIDRRLAWLRHDDSNRARGIRAAEVDRMLQRARIKGGAKRIPNDIRDLMVQRAQTQSLKELAEALIVARWLSARTEGDVGERT